MGARSNTSAVNSEPGRGRDAGDGEAREVTSGGARSACGAWGELPRGRSQTSWEGSGRVRGSGGSALQPKGVRTSCPSKTRFMEAPSPGGPEAKFSRSRRPLRSMVVTLSDPEFWSGFLSC